MKTIATKGILTAAALLLLAGGASAAEAKKKAVPAKEKAPEAAQEQPAAEQKAQQAAPPPAQEAPADDSLDVTITAESKDEIPLTMDPPPASLPFDRVAALSREGQTDRVLASPVEHMNGWDQMGFLRIESRQAYLGMPARVPGAPFIRMEVAPGLAAARWSLEVLDQNDAVLKPLSGTEMPKNIVEWDGFMGGDFKLRAGPAYTPVLILSDERGRSQRYFGEPVHFAALQFIQEGLLHIEFDNSRLFERGRSGFAQDAKPYLSASLNILRQRLGKPIKVGLAVSAATQGGIAQKRLQNLKAFFKDGLALEDDAISFAIDPAGSRGDVTSITTLDK